MQQKKKEGPHGGPSLFLWSLSFYLRVGPPQFTLYFSFSNSKGFHAVTILVGARCAGASRHASFHGGASGDVLKHAVWKDCRTSPVPRFVDPRKRPTGKLLLRSLRKCASLESPSEKSPVSRIQAQREPNVRRKKEEGGNWVSKEERADGSARELCLQQVEHGVLLRDHLGLPNQSDRHQTHREDAQRQNQAHLCFRSRYTEYATHPSHGGSRKP